MAAFSAAGIIASQLFAPALALTLEGHANVSTVPEMSNYAAPITLQSQTAQVAMAQPPAGPNFNLAASTSQPKAYEGMWRCVSQVTNSTVPSVSPGRQMECLLRFRVADNGRLFVYWDQAGWNPTNCSVVHYTPAESSILHRSAVAGSSGWEAVSRDRLRMVSSSQMEGRSQVVQYQSGQVIGTYETNSVLTRVE